MIASGMTNTEINKRITELLGYTIKVQYVGGEIMTDCKPPKFLDYCKTPSDLMPLVWEHNISMIKCIGIHNYLIQGLATTKTYAHHNPQIALCLCLIDVLEAEKRATKAMQILSDCLKGQNT